MTNWLATTQSLVTNSPVTSVLSSESPHTRHESLMIEIEWWDWHWEWDETKLPSQVLTKNGNVTNKLCVRWKWIQMMRLCQNIHNHRIWGIVRSGEFSSGLEKVGKDKSKLIFETGNSSEVVLYGLIRTRSIESGPLKVALYLRTRAEPAVNVGGPRSRSKRVWTMGNITRLG